MVNHAINKTAMRVDWVDVAKGLCIILVVMMHSTLGIEKAAGETSLAGAFVAWAQPFRMPDFFMIAGLFLARSIDKDWKTFLDRKVVHFVYFYLLWMVIQCGIKCSIAADHWTDVPAHMIVSLIEPFGTLWFVYLLPVFFLATRLVRKANPLHVLVIAALLEIAPIHTGSTVIDEFAARYVYFFAGYAFAPIAFTIAAEVRRNRVGAILMLFVWAVVNSLAVLTPVQFAGFDGPASHLPVISLILGGLGALAVISVSAILTDMKLGAVLRVAGERSIVIYLAFFLPMAMMRALLLRYAPDMSLTMMALIDTGFAVLTPLAIDWSVRRLGHGSFLFRRPEWARLVPEKAPRSGLAFAAE